METPDPTLPPADAAPPPTDAASPPTEATPPPAAATTPLQAPPPLAANVAYATAAAMICNLCLFLLNLVVVRLYGQGVHGSVTLVISAATLAASLGDLGLASKAGVWMISRLRAEGSDRLAGMISATWTVQLGAAAALSAGLAALADWLAPWAGGDAVGLRIAATWVLLQAAIRACTMVSIALERMVDLLIVLPTAEVLRLGWTVVCGQRGLGTDWLYWGWGAAYLISLGLAVWRTAVLGRGFGLRLRLVRSSLAQSAGMILDAAPYFVNYLGLFGLQFVVQILLGALGGQVEQVSVLQVCFALAIIPRLLANPVATALFPRITRTDAQARPDHSQTSAVLGVISRLLGLTSTALYAGFWLAGPWVLGVLYGPVYARSVATLLVLTVAISLESYAQQLDQVLMAMGRAKAAAWLEGLKYATVVAACAAMVPAWHELGAAAATLAAMGVSAATRMVLARRLVGGAGERWLLASLAVMAAVTLCGLLPGGRYWAAAAWAAAAPAAGLVRWSDLRRWTGRVWPARGTAAGKK